MKNNVKIEKLNSLIMRELNQILLKEFKDFDSLSSITIHEVRTTNELSLPKIYYSYIPDDNSDLEIIQNQLDKKNNSIRYKLAQKLTVYKIPKLVFIHDVSLEKGNKIDSILNKINKKENKNN